MTPLERAARAICKDPDWGGDGNQEPIWKSYLPAVRAVLLAIREPSEAMRKQGGSIGDQLIASPPGATPYLYEDASSKIWQAMIDAALEEGATK